jgi:uncharacterized membrane protein
VLYKYLKLLILFLLLLINAGNFILIFIQYNSHLAYLLIPINKGFSLICHQQSEKLFLYGSLNTLLCSRCTGIYLGSLTALLFIISGLKTYKSSVKFFYVSIFLMLLDIIFYSSGIYNYSQWIAAVTGFIFGIAVLLLLIKSLKNLEAEISPGKN